MNECKQGVDNEMVTAFSRALFYFCSSGVIFVLASRCGYQFFLQNGEHPGHQLRRDFVTAMAAWDGEWYVRITSDPDLFISSLNCPAATLDGGSSAFEFDWRRDGAQCPLPQGVVC